MSKFNLIDSNICNNGKKKIIKGRKKEKNLTAGQLLFRANS